MAKQDNNVNNNNKNNNNNEDGGMPCHNSLILLAHIIVPLRNTR